MNLIEWFTRRLRTGPDQSPSRLREADRVLADLQSRSEHVDTQLRARLQRNHWSETIAAIARGES